MKVVLLILSVVFVAGSACAQSWRDSLEHGKQLYNEGKYEEAYNSLIQAQKLAPEDVDLSKDIGNAAYRKGDYEMAEKAYRSVASSAEDSEQSSKQWHNIGNAQLQKKDYQAAIESYKQALRENPGNEDARYNLAEAKRRLKKQKQEQQKKNNDKNQDKNQDQKNQDQNQNQGDDQQNKNQSGDNNKENDGQQKSQSNDSGKNGKSQQQKGAEKLSSKKTERMLDELLKKEMSTKRKAVGTKSSSSEEVKSGKKW
tara:strand:+ start:36767 stop:37531 length:765 start_codon:yes stop_codon:yes gene_type:complete